MGASQRRKGADAERELRRRLVDLLGEELAGQVSQDRSGGCDIVGVGRFAIEVKRRERPEIESWWVQACDQAEARGQWPALAWRQSRRPWQVLVPLQTILGGEADPRAAPRAALDLEGFSLLVREVEEAAR